MKKLIAAAVAAAVVAPAMAVAAGPTLYGKIHTAIEYHDNNASGAADYSEWGMTSRSSRIGVKGSEDLGNGMKVGYLIEWEIQMDGTGSDMGQRNRAVTLSGDWGTALAGRWDTPFKSLGRKVDLFGDQSGDLRAINGDHDLRLDNVVAYVTPNMNGFSATIAYSFDAQLGGGTNDNGASGETTDASAVSFNAIYNNGPILVGVGYTDVNQDDVAKGATGESDTSSWRVGGTYTMGDLKLAASYTDFDSLGFVDNADPDVWTIGAAYTMGNNKIKVQYADRDESQGGADDEADMWAIGLDHAMSKRTTVYVTYATLDNDDNSTLESWSGGMSNHSGGAFANGQAAGGKDTDSFAVGIIHNF